MSVEPQKFFVGLMDFFSILLPGALLSYLLADDIGKRVIGDERYLTMPEVERWAVFLVASYLVGHFIFLIGSWLDEAYDHMRNHTLNQQVSHLAFRHTLLPRWKRFIAAVVFKRERDRAVKRAERLKQQSLGPLQAGSAINAFQWAKAALAIEKPEHLASVERYEADSKFFRSLIVVLAVLAGIWIAKGAWQLAIGAALLIPLAMWRYMEQRYKATNHAYWYVMALAGHGKRAIPAAVRSPSDPTHAGGVVYRRRNDDVEYLLVEAKHTAEEWVLPKGHVEEGEHPRETAVREVREETGVWARICGELKRVTLTVDGLPISVLFYLMEALEEGRPTDRRREHLWLRFDRAHSRANHLESRELLQMAEQARIRQRDPQ